MFDPAESNDNGWHGPETAPISAAEMRTSRQLTRTILIVLAAVAITTGLVLLMLGAADLGDMLSDLATDLIAAAVVIFALQWVLARRQVESAIEARKQRLIHDLRSGHEDTSRLALEEMREQGWLFDGSLHGTNLKGAVLRTVDLAGVDLSAANLTTSNLHRAVLAHANLHGARMDHAYLQGGNLWSANLQSAFLQSAILRNSRARDANMEEVNLMQADLAGSDLTAANLRWAFMWEANLEEADLSLANLNGAVLVDANLRGANLTDANLKGAHISDAQCNEKTILPDKRPWRATIDWRRYTDPDYPAYWEPQWIKLHRELAAKQAAPVRSDAPVKE